MRRHSVQGTRLALVCRLATVALFTAVVIPAAPAGASDEECLYGDVRALFETFLQAADDGPPPCQFRLWRHGDTFTFSEDAFFLGGFGWIENYHDRASRKQAVKLLESIDLTIGIAEVTASGVGPMVQQTVERTEIKTGSDEFGKLVWAQWGIIRQLPAGEYVIETKFDTETWVIRLVITPSS